jgi:hypothetical protein
MNDKVNNNLIIVNSSTRTASNFPREIFAVRKTKVYLYPKPIEDHAHISTPSDVVALYRSYTGGGTYTGGGSPNKMITLRSIKKDL